MIILTGTSWRRKSWRESLVKKVLWEKRRRSKSRSFHNDFGVRRSLCRRWWSCFFRNTFTCILFERKLLKHTSLLKSTLLQWCSCSYSDNSFEGNCPCIEICSRVKETISFLRREKVEDVLQHTLFPRSFLRLFLTWKVEETLRADNLFQLKRQTQHTLFLFLSSRVFFFISLDSHDFKDLLREITIRHHPSLWSSSGMFLLHFEEIFSRKLTMKRGGLRGNPSVTSTQTWKNCLECRGINKRRAMSALRWTVSVTQTVTWGVIIKK